MKNIFGLALIAFSSTALACPNLDGVFLEDDYGYRITQKSCNEIFLDGEFIYSYDDFDVKQTDGVEHVCHDDDHSTKFCKAAWDKKALRVSMREVFKNPVFEPIETSIEVVRCDDLQPNCNYGDGERAASDVIQITTPEFGTVQIPRWNPPQP